MYDKPFIGEADAARSRNSMVFIEAASASASKPDAAIPSSVDMISCTTSALAASPNATPFKPTEKADC